MTNPTTNRRPKKAYSSGCGSSAKRTRFLSIIMGSLSWRLNRPDDHAHSFHRDDFDRRARLNERAFGHDVDSFATDDGGARGPKRGQRLAGLIEQLGLVRPDVPDGLL